ncbi:MAG: hypothetical protein HY515_02215 [Candidatus Aenigmarchaeota archaeon]|nr:hypothetical protein [Candidatus Aenigmarchaeota archaeon]
MQTSRRFAQYVRENGVNGGDAVCGIYRLVRTLNDGRQIIATFIDPYNQGVENNPRAELRVFVSRALDAEETGLNGNVDSLNIFAQGEWVCLDRTDSAMNEYQNRLYSYLRSLQSKHSKLKLDPRWQLQMAA